MSDDVGRNNKKIKWERCKGVQSEIRINHPRKCWSWAEERCRAVAATSEGSVYRLQAFIYFGIFQP